MSRLSWVRRGLVIVGVALGVSLASPAAQADESIIGIPGEHPAYRFEAEPHGLLGFGGPFEHGYAEVGAGFRGTIVIVDNGFVTSINDSVGITFGVDIFLGHGTLFIPVALQWNFWLTPHWSVLAEPGIGFAANAYHADAVSPIIDLGARYHFNDKVSLTMRVGYPALSIGASFFL